MQIPGGHLADKFGPKKIVTIALSIVCIGNFGIAFAGSYEQLLFWKFLVGFGTGTSFVAGARYIFQSTPTNKLLLYQAIMEPVSYWGLDLSYLPFLKLQVIFKVGRLHF